MSGDEIDSLKIDKAANPGVEIRSHVSFEAGASPSLASRDVSAGRNSCAAGEDRDSSLRLDKADGECPGISEHPGYWGIFVRKGS
jgi:hypothetical protein